MPEYSPAQDTPMGNRHGLARYFAAGLQSPRGFCTPRIRNASFAESYRIIEVPAAAGSRYGSCA
jgi:hypothetical protein